MEIWKPVEQTKGLIEVSNYGRVRSLLRGSPHVLKTQRDRKGYERVRVTIEREKLSLKVHREVAKAFIRNEANLPQVNHIDGNKSNNAVSNLEWVTCKDNAMHAIRSGLWDTTIEAARKENMSRMKRIKAINSKYPYDEIAFESVSAAERFFDSRHISDALKGKRSHVKGYSFEYLKGGAENDRTEDRATE